MKYSNVKDIIEKEVAKYSKSLDEAIDLLTVAEEIAYAKNMKLVELKKEQIKYLHDFAKYNESIPKMEYRSGDDVDIVNQANLINAEIIKKYIHADVLFCGIGVSMYLKLIKEWMIDDNEYAIRDTLFNNGILYGMKIKSLPNTVIPTDEFVYIDKETDEIIKCKIEGLI